MNFVKKCKNVARRIICYPYKEKFCGMVWKIGHLPGIKLFSFFFVEILGGYRVYIRLLHKYGKNTMFYICPHHGTGDMYNIGMYFERYIKNNNVKKYEFLFRGRSEQKIGELFDIHGETILSDRETIRLMRFVRFVQPEYVNVVQLHHYPFPVEANGSFANLEEFYKGISFTTMFKKVVMNLDDNVVPKMPTFLEPDDINQIFEDNHLLPGRTVILAPYSTSAQVIDDETWEEIVDRLKENGFTVATNCVLGKERAISGTVPLSFEYKYAKAYVEHAGVFVAARSGLCDVVSSTDCQKIILTPYWAPSLGWQGTPGKSMRFYGMWPNYRRTNTVEIEYDFDSFDQLPDTIIELLKNTKKWEPEIRLKQDLKPKYENEIGIALSFSEEFAPFASVTLQSIIEFSNKENTYDIVLLHDGLVPKTKEMIKSAFENRDNFCLRFIDCRPLIANKHFYAEQRGFSHVSYNRIALPSLLNQFKKIIYLDSDMIMNTDIAELYSYELGSNLIAAVRDLPMIAWASDPDNPEHDYLVNELKISNYANYINAGFLIVNVEEFNKAIPFDYIMRYAQSHKFRWVDQDVFNKLCDERISFLPQEFNTITSLRNDSEIIRNSKAPELIAIWKKALKDPKILHFIGKNFIYINNPPPHLQKYWMIAQKSPFYELLRLRVHVALRG